MTEFITKRVSNVGNDVLSGITVALALVPEAVAFAFVAGVDPLVGLYAAFMVGLITSIFGLLVSDLVFCLECLSSQFRNKKKTLKSNSRRINEF